MFESLFENGGLDIYVATVLNDKGTWDGAEVVYLPTRTSVKATGSRSFAQNYREAKKALVVALEARGIL